MSELHLRSVSATGEHVRVLYLEDETADVDLVERALTKGGLDVRIQRVANEQEFRQALRGDPWDIILTDFRLPSFDGLAALRVLREEGIGAPCILVSGTVGEETAAEAMREGARDFVLKGNLVRLAAAVRRELADAKRRARSQRLEHIHAALRDVAFEAGRLLDPTGLAQYAIARAQELLEVDIASLYWWSEHRQVLELLAESASGGVPVDTIRIGEGASGVAFQRRAPVIIEDYATWTHRLIDTTGSAVAVPAMVGDRPVGTLYVRSVQPRPFTEEDAVSLQLLASQVAPALAVSQLVSALRVSEERFVTVFRHNPVGIMATRAADGEILDVNDSLLQLLGYGREELIGRRIAEMGLTWAEPRQLVAGDNKDVRPHAGVELQVTGRQGETHEVIVYSEPIVLSEGPAVLSSVVDISARRSAERMLRHQSLHDELTGLPNRAYLYEQLHALIERQAASGNRVALLFAGLDGFSAANDEFGHHGGDLLLTQVARRLRRHLPAEHTLARMGGDEFAVVLAGAAANDADAVALGILGALDSPFTVGDQQVPLGASIGVALSPEHATTADDLMKYATVALQTAKQIGWTYATYQSVGRDVTSPNLGLLGEFRDAIARNELLLFYQPQFELRNRHLVGAEALLRWQHPKRGLLTPPAFLPLAERTNLMRPLLEWVLRTALTETRDLGLHVAVNLAMRNLLEPGLTDVVANALGGARRSPSDLTLEITEGGVMSNPETATRVLDELRELGCRLSIDDFGTGYSSMAYLQRLPTHELKIDRSFVRGIPRDARNTSIVQASIALAHGLGLVVVAEGVEDEGNLAALITLGCDRAQGYLLGRPGPVQALPAL